MNGELVDPGILIARAGHLLISAQGCKHVTSCSELL